MSDAARNTPSRPLSLGDLHERAVELAAQGVERMTLDGEPTITLRMLLEAIRDRNTPSTYGTGNPTYLDALAALAILEKDDS